jgi:hypothetical protein
VLRSYVQHAIHLSVDAQYIDVTIDLTFFEEWSASERKAMDADGNGSVTRSEQEAYLKRVEADTKRQVRLFVAGHEVPLAPLYPPAIDLLGDYRVGPAHHRLRVCCFSTTPVGLQAGDEIAVQDRLWPKANIILTTQAEGADGCRLATAVQTNTDSLPEKAVLQRQLTFKCLQPPSTELAAQPEGRGTLSPNMAEPGVARREITPPSNRNQP